MARFVPYQSSRALFTPTPQLINGIEEAIAWAEAEVPANLAFNVSELAFYMAVINQGEARKLSFGPYDPRGRDSSQAWQVPVRRISQRYYLGWKIRRRAPGVWQLYNDSREAYFIEFGISRVGFGAERDVPVGRIRRPIRKLSLLKTLEFMSRTNAYHRVWASIYTHKGRGYGFTQVIQSPGGGHSIFEPWNTPNAGSGEQSGPMLGRRLP